MSVYLRKANEMEEDLRSWRRYLHQNPELGLDLPITTAFIVDRLKSFGLAPKEISQSGIVCLVEGKEKGGTFLLRGDTDALPMPEEADLPFKSRKENMAHTCAHDMHATMLLGAAKLLSESRGNFKGTVKLMFQPGEETLEGARSMIAAGLLDNPAVDAAMGMHVMLDGPVGGIGFGTGYMSSSSDSIVIDIMGKGGHGAMPHQSVDPINVGAHIYLACQSLIARENPTNATTALSICQFTAGSSFNIIPDTAYLRGTLRTYDPSVRERMKQRLPEIVGHTAAAFGAKAECSFPKSVPSILSDAELVNDLVGYIDKLGYDFYKIPDYKIFPSEDFSVVSEKVKSTYLVLCAKTEGNDYPQHNPFVVFDEAVMPLGAAIYAQCAAEWLNNH